MLDAPAIAAALADLKELHRDCPLALWRAWDRPEPQTSQRRALQLLALFRVLIVLGGNRSGKTELMRAVLVALARGSDDPIARIFWLANGCNPDDFPKGPGRCWIVARSSNDSIRYHRKQIGRLLGSAGVRWWNKNGPGEARVEIDIPGYDYPAEIWFKSEDQGVDAMQGDACRAILHDEEGNSGDVWTEASVRLWDQRGWHLMSNTPIKGLTWVYDQFVARNEEGAKVVWIHSADNPFLPQAELRKLERGSSALAAARLRGEFVALEGRIYDTFSRAVHVVEPFDIPDTWLRFRGIDFGTRAPFVCLWAALSPDDRLYVYREHYQPGWTLTQHVAVMRRSEGWTWDAESGDWAMPDGPVENFDCSWADPEDAQLLMQLAHTHDLDFNPAHKAVRAGLDLVAERFDPQQAGGPALFIFSTCTNTLREHEGYVWGDATQGNKPERPRKRDDHTCDALRYICMGLRLAL